MSCRTTIWVPVAGHGVAGWLDFRAGCTSAYSSSCLAHGVNDTDRHNYCAIVSDWYSCKFSTCTLCQHTWWHFQSLIVRVMMAYNVNGGVKDSTVSQIWKLSAQYIREIAFRWRWSLRRSERDVSTSMIQNLLFGYVVLGNTVMMSTATERWISKFGWYKKISASKLCANACSAWNISRPRSRLWTRAT